MATSIDKQHAHDLIDRLPSSQLTALISLLEAIVDPVTSALRNAPFDDEPETSEEQQKLLAAKTWLRNNGGKGIPHSDAHAKAWIGVSSVEWTEASLSDLPAPTLAQ